MYLLKRSSNSAAKPFTMTSPVPLATGFAASVGFGAVVGAGAAAGAAADVVAGAAGLAASAGFAASVGFGAGCPPGENPPQAALIWVMTRMTMRIAPRRAMLHLVPAAGVHSLYRWPDPKCQRSGQSTRGWRGLVRSPDDRLRARLSEQVIADPDRVEETGPVGRLGGLQRRHPDQDG